MVIPPEALLTCIYDFASKFMRIYVRKEPAAGAHGDAPTRRQNADASREPLMSCADGYLPLGVAITNKGAGSDIPKERELLKPHPPTTNVNRMSIRSRDASIGSAALSNQSSRTAGNLT
jgi:hypothetical protein